MSTYIANVGTDNASWLANELDRANGNRIGTDLGDGRVQITTEGLNVLRDLTPDEDGSITEADDKHGIQTWIGGIGYELTPQ